MGSSLPPDPYAALGVPKTATQGDVKTAHRKLVLKCHPDKVADPAAKQAASDQFHRIQTAYEILSDEDRRARYDAEIKLAELRREAFERGGSSGNRASDSRVPSSYKSSNEPASRGPYPARERPNPVYEERRPSYAPGYFDYSSARPTMSRRESEMERTSRRPAHDGREKPRASARDAKDTERERRREKMRRADVETRRSRDYKHSTYVEDDSSDSGSDEYTRRERRMREEDEVRRYYEQGRRGNPETVTSPSDDQSRKMKMSAASLAAWEHMRSSGGRQRSDKERRPSPPRYGTTTKDNVEYLRREPGRPPVVVRRPSERPRATARDSDSSLTDTVPDPARRTSAENVNDARRPPTFRESRSSPADLYNHLEKGRSQSLQEDHNPLFDMPKVKRADTDRGFSRAENVSPPRNANTRPTQLPDGGATPGAMPEYTGPSGASSAKYKYARSYADDTEYATPEGYRTEMRQPPGDSMRPRLARKSTRSPSPTKEAAREMREKGRTPSSRYPGSQAASNKPTASYAYTPGQGTRPIGGRATDAREPRPALFGEVSGPASRPRYASYDAPEGGERRAKPARAESFKVQSGFSYKRDDSERLNRGGSGNPIYTTARG